MRRQRIRAFVTASALVILTCGFVILPSVRSLGQEQSPEAGMSDVTTINDLFAEIGMRVPEFGGMYVDPEKDTLYVYAVNAGPDFVPRLDKAITDVLGPDRPRERRIEVLPAQYSFMQLKEWHDRISMQVLAIPGAVLTEIDHSTNRLKVGVETLAIEPQIGATLAELDVPRETVNIEVMPHIEQQTLSPDTGADTDQEWSDPAGCPPNCTLRSDLHSDQPTGFALLGGIQIQAMGQGACTLSFAVSGTPVGGFVTASHCTGHQGGVQKTKFFQPTDADTQVAVEKTDPCYWPTPPGCTPVRAPLWCPPGMSCRLSNAVFAKRGRTITLFTGALAQPATLSPNTCTPPVENVPPACPHPAGRCDVCWFTGDLFNVREENGNRLVMVGDVVNKVGRTSGWTRGTVTGVCVNVNAAPGITDICQTTANYAAFGGDSGSPVFRCIKNGVPFACKTTDRSPDVRIMGSHEGGVAGPGFHWFAPVGKRGDGTVTGEQATQELGPLNKCSNGGC